MENQAETFRASEGDAWHERNKDRPRLPDPVMGAIESCDLRPKGARVLEIGCGTGWRLAALHDKYVLGHSVGYEPSPKAVKERVWPNVFAATAMEALPHIRKRYYDLIIFGFCLYLVDREDLFMVIAGADSALKDGGHIIIHDFTPDYAHRQPYKHKDGIWSYKMNHAMLWLSNPAYRMYHVRHEGEGNDATGVCVLQKDMASAFPVREL